MTENKVWFITGAGIAGADAVETVEQKATELLAQVDAHRDLSTSLAFDA